jgi:hypothetical protein
MLRRLVLFIPDSGPLFCDLRLQLTAFTLSLIHIRSILCFSIVAVLGRRQTPECPV